MKNSHIPVLLNQVISNFSPKEGGNYLDCTLGSGGHLAAMLEKTLSKDITTAKFFAFDVDQIAWTRFQDRLTKQGVEFTTEGNTLQIGGIVVEFFQTNFANIQALLPTEKFDFILADLGPSQNQLDDDQLGLSYSSASNSPLDMRIDPQLQVTAADLVALLNPKQLANLLSDFGGLDVKTATRISKLLKSEQPKFTTDLNRIIQEAKADYQNLDKLTRQVFQALRIAVNLEFENLDKLLNLVFSSLSPKGKFAIITFHSAESARVVKFAKLHSIQISRLAPLPKEIQQNPRARSSNLYLFLNTFK